MSKSKAKGTAAETATVNALRRLGFPAAERRALAGGKDKGDITGTPGLAWEVKAAKALTLSEWMRETAEETVNAAADYGILVVKLPALGAGRAHLWLTVMEWEDHVRLAQRRQQWLMGCGVWATAQPLRALSLKAVGVEKAVDALCWAEKEYHKSLVGVRLARRRSTAAEPVPLDRVGVHPGYYHLMRLDARCRVLLDAGYGSREIITATTSSSMKENGDEAAR